MIFLETNKNAPYVVKKTVTDACFNACFFYGCEGWLGVKPIACIKDNVHKSNKTAPRSAIAIAKTNRRW